MNKYAVYMTHHMRAYIEVEAETEEEVRDIAPYKDLEESDWHECIDTDIDDIKLMEENIIGDE
jgi:hypothetical protein